MLLHLPGAELREAQGHAASDRAAPVQLRVRADEEDLRTDRADGRGLRRSADAAGGTRGMRRGRSLVFRPLKREGARASSPLGWQYEVTWAPKR